MNEQNRKKEIEFSRFAAVLALLLISGSAATAMAEVVSTGVAVEENVEPEAKSFKPPYRGSEISYRNAVTALSLKKDADPTYNPYYGMDWTFSPKWWVGDVFNAFAGLTLSRELTHSDWTTKSGETTLGDVNAGLGASNFVTIPVLEIGISGKLTFVAPTSKASQARTMVLGIKPGLTLSRNFDVLSGISLWYAFSYTGTIFEATTAQQEEPHISCASNPRACESYMNTGRRNAPNGIGNMFGLNVSFVDWLTYSANVGVTHSFLYDQKDATGEQMSEWQPGDPDADVRYTMIYGMELAATPNPALTIALGAETANPQLRPDSTYEKPFFNRNTAIYLDLRLSIAGLVEQVTSSEE